MSREISTICTAPDFQEEARKNAREASLVTARVDTPGAGG